MDGPHLEPARKIAQDIDAAKSLESGVERRRASWAPSAANRVATARPRLPQAPVITRLMAISS
jgi:hypothetical protein